jgi:hypothetical protein
MGPRQGWDLAQGTTSQSALKVLSVRLRVNAEMQDEPSDKTESQSYCAISGRVLSRTPPMTNMATAWVKTTRAPPTILAQQYCSSHGTLFFPSKAVRTEDRGDTPLLMTSSPRQFYVYRQSVGCICPEKRLQSTTIARIKPYLEYPDRPRAG